MKVSMAALKAAKETNQKAGNVMKKVNVAILGATGAVGREMLKVLEERKFPINRLKALASARSAGMSLPFAGGSVIVEEATDRKSVV